MNLVSLLVLPAVITQAHHTAIRYTISGVALAVLLVAIAFSKRKTGSMADDAPAVAARAHRGLRGSPTTRPLSRVPRDLPEDGCAHDGRPSPGRRTTREGADGRARHRRVPGQGAAHPGDAGRRTTPSCSSRGHVRDLPDSASPAARRASSTPRSGAPLGVDAANHFKAVYVVTDPSKVRPLKDALKSADELLLATDEDREGEAIAWHLVEVLNVRRCRCGGWCSTRSPRRRSSRRSPRPATSTTTS